MLRLACDLIILCVLCVNGPGHSNSGVMYVHYVTAKTIMNFVHCASKADKKIDRQTDYKDIEG